MRSGDIIQSADIALAALTRAVETDWSARAGDLEWSCRRTLDHIVDTLLLYGSYVATRAVESRATIRNGDPEASVPVLLAHLDASARMLELICDGTRPPLRAFHPSGLSDADGYRAMACSEALTHTRQHRPGTRTRPPPAGRPLRANHDARLSVGAGSAGVPRPVGGATLVLWPHRAPHPASPRRALVVARRAHR
jgi:hypothetical protein